MPLQAGKLRHRATLDHKTVSLDSYGAETVTWANFANVWASVEDLAGRELWAAQAEQGEVTTKVIIRYRSDIVMTDRVTANGRTFDIIGISDPDGRETHLLLYCRELRT